MDWLSKKIGRLQKSLNPSFRTSSGMRYVNWFNEEEHWLERFIVNRFPDYKYSEINLVSLNGKRWKVNLYRGKKIFFSQENLSECTEIATLVNGGKKVTHKNITNYGDYMLKDVDLSLAYKTDIDAKNYLRFPLWIVYLMRDSVCCSDIESIVNAVNQKKSKAIKESVVISSHDIWGMRGLLCDALTSEIDITYAGKWRNNTDELWTKFNDDKLDYLNIFKFNICPENMDAVDYCTEKLFESLMAGCIPIYAGCNNSPEPGIVNENFIIKWNLIGDNEENIKLIRRLKNDDEFYRKWMEQEKLHSYATEYIYDRLQKLEEKLREIL